MSEIFVFGSNMAGIHGKGSALEARKKYGAKSGVGVGRTGNAYAIPTKNSRFEVLSLDLIKYYVLAFLVYARLHPELTFKCVAIGCGLAGYTPAQIASFFLNSPPNVILPTEFLVVLNKK